jgi:hypothetical protein
MFNLEGQFAQNGSMPFFNLSDFPLSLVSLFTMKHFLEVDNEVILTVGFGTTRTYPSLKL